MRPSLRRRHDEGEPRPGQTGAPLTSSEVASVLEAPAAPLTGAPALPGAAAAAAELVLVPPRSAAQATAAPLGGHAPLVGPLLGGQRRLALLAVLLQQLGRLLLLQLAERHPAEALALLGQGEEPWGGQGCYWEPVGRVW